MIHKLPNGEYRLMSKDGEKNLGTFKTEEQAVHHEQQVEWFKAHRTGQHPDDQKKK